jgi:hypothetical protein
LERDDEFQLSKQGAEGITFLEAQFA